MPDDARRPVPSDDDASAPEAHGFLSTRQLQSLLRQTDRVRSHLGDAVHGANAMSEETHRAMRQAARTLRSLIPSEARGAVTKAQEAICVSTEAPVDVALMLASAMEVESRLPNSFRLTAADVSAPTPRYPSDVIIAGLTALGTAARATGTGLCETVTPASRNSSPS